jgi:two-component system nitrogen regulation response regulator NtrX
VLRVLEEGEIQRVGSSKVAKVDVRVIAATNKDLKKEIAGNNFRDDLYFRLNVVPIYSPALREKREDIPVLIDYFSRNYAEENNFRPKRFAPEALEAMLNYSWKGNVRELRNVVERLMIMSEGEVITRQDLPEPIGGAPRIELPDPAAVKTLKDFRDLAERDFIVAKLQKNNWNISQTAREIDTPRSNLYKKLAQYGIKITVGLSEAGGAEPRAEKPEPGSD